MNKDYLEEFYNTQFANPEYPSSQGMPKFSELSEDEKHHISCLTSYAGFVMNKHFTELGRGILRFFGIK